MEAAAVFFNFAGMTASMDRHMQEFILEHEDSDISGLILHRDRWPEIDMTLAAKCIQGRSKARTKLPAWYAEPGLIYPGSLSLEQCSSQATAFYKQRFVTSSDKVADLTGGLGADAWSLSLKAASVDYYERSEELCECAAHNFRLLGRKNISVHNAATGQAMLNGIPSDHYSLIYIDPARRGKDGSRVYSLKDCEPDITLLRTELLRIAPRILLKASPMADISALLSELPEAAEVHVLSHGYECKEVLVLMQKGSALPREDIPVCAAELPLCNGSCGQARAFKFTLREEKEATAELAKPSEIKGYLYEPSPALMKSGAFALPAVRFGLQKISASTHFYTCKSVIGSFPGKIRKITGVLPFSKAVIRDFRKLFPSCSITARNFPMTSEQLRKRLGTTESSTLRALATTLADGSKAIILSSPAEQA